MYEKGTERVTRMSETSSRIFKIVSNLSKSDLSESSLVITEMAKAAIEAKLCNSKKA